MGEVGRISKASLFSSTRTGIRPNLHRDQVDSVCQRFLAPCCPAYFIRFVYVKDAVFRAVLLSMLLRRIGKRRSSSCKASARFALRF